MPLSTSWTYFKFIFREKEENIKISTMNHVVLDKLRLFNREMVFIDSIYGFLQTYWFYGIYRFCFQSYQNLLSLFKQFFPHSFSEMTSYGKHNSEKGNQIACKGVLGRKVNSYQKMWMKTAHNLDEKFKVFLHSRYFKRHIFYFSKHLKK